MENGKEARTTDGELLTIIYVSSARQIFSDTELETLLLKARTANAANAISGLLLYQDGNFMQLLEGPQAAVSELYAVIRRDPRHHDIVTLIEETGLPREFSAWSMAYRKLDNARWGALLESISNDDQRQRASLAKRILRDFWHAGSQTPP
jgi:hypothetical protein